MFEFLFSKSENQRIKKLETRVNELEAALFETTEMLKRLAALSLQTGRELESLSEYVKLQEKRSKVPSILPKKPDDFYN